VRKKRIAIDLDDTLNNLCDSWLPPYNKDYNDHLKRENLVKWKIDELVKPECGNKIYDYLREPGFFKNLNIQPEAKEVTEWLVKYYDIQIVTAYFPESCVDKADFIKIQLPHIDPKNIIFCNDKSWIKADYMIDDGAHNILGFEGQGIVVDAPYNRFLGNQYPRVYTWQDIKIWFNLNDYYYINIAHKGQ
jgi:5'(3')-deoxyribonucleotidase